ncbi:recombinase family protein [Candidatus Uabimicrobium sp. HlEnr_7]|uniref:recombinase family protein n=1 Tax=Candidatus Uabimicrobium helgolandensis TaxID=3095367 RepID=UPI003557DF99
MTKYIAYYRVSIKNKNDLELKEQKDHVEHYVGIGNIIESFVERESAKNKKRPLLEKAICLCAQYGYTLVIAKLDRLGRKKSIS